MSFEGACDCTGGCWCVQGGEQDGGELGTRQQQDTVLDEEDIEDESEEGVSAWGL